MGTLRQRMAGAALPTAKRRTEAHRWPPSSIAACPLLAGARVKAG